MTQEIQFDMVKFSKGQNTVTTALKMRFGDTGITDYTELEIPGRTSFLVIFDEGQETEERWYMPEECLEVIEKNVKCRPFF